jgi:glycosyltransferase involved in cell wall biosynthesis
MDLSVIVCTRNRAMRLRHFLQVMTTVEVPTGVSWELLVVDNASTDLTSVLIKEEIARRRLPIVDLKEPVPGKSRALNSALMAAQGELVVFTDDDTEPRSSWLRAYLHCAKQYNKVYGFAGRILPKWDGFVPQWFKTHRDNGVLRSLAHIRDLGDNICYLPEGSVPGGANAALRRSAIERMGEFRVDLGPGTSNPCAEDMEYMRRLIEQGERFLYVPEATAYHLNDSGKLTESYALRWAYDVARCQVLAFGQAPTGPLIFGVPRYLWRKLLGRSVKVALSAISDDHFRNRLRFMQALGELKGYMTFDRVDEKNKTGSF